MGNNSPSKVHGKWKHFERLVAAIHRVADQGADVRWNDKINRRQFDVTIRFRRGLYEYLTVIECKDHKKAVPAEKVEAFVTKAADARANQAVMASTSGFQPGAQDVARQHNTTLIHVTESADINLSSMFGAQPGDTIDALHIERIELEYVDGERKCLPGQSNAMTYYVGHILLQSGSDQKTLNDLVHTHSSGFASGPLDGYRNHVIPCPADTRVIGPDDGEIPLKPLACVHVRAAITKANTLKGPIMFDPYLLVPDLKVRNVDTGEEKVFSQDSLSLGFDTVFQEGGFYEQPRLAQYYYCGRIEGEVATLYLVESYQLGELIRAKFTTSTKAARGYVAVSDRIILERLKRRLAELKMLEAKNQDR